MYVDSIPIKLGSLPALTKFLGKRSEIEVKSAQWSGR
jgi:hypothetical protein